MNNPGYQLLKSEHGLFVEIYLPKKAEYQGTLYQVLTEGFDLAHVRRHFTEQGAKVAAFLQDFQTGWTADDAAELEQVFTGYSMYEVDGVFYNPQTREIAEERSQVIRLNFKTDLSRVATELPEDQALREVHNYLAAAGAWTEEFERAAAEGAEARGRAQLVEYLDRWRAQVAHFVFGYIIFELCERFQELRVSKGHRAEEELLVTSFWNLTLNRVVKLGAEAG